MTDPTCETCRWWRKATGRRGECRRYAPRPVISDTSLGDPAFSWWAATINDEGCGEHQPRQPAEAAPEQPDTAALTAERDQAMQAREQMGARIAALEDALRPFATAADDLEVIEQGGCFVWNCTAHRESISTWMGPSDFGRARAALSGTPPRQRIDPETRRVLEEARDGLRRAADTMLTEGNRAIICAKHAEDIRAHLAKMEAEHG